MRRYYRLSLDASTMQWQFQLWGHATNTIETAEFVNCPFNYYVAQIGGR